MSEIKSSASAQVLREISYQQVFDAIAKATTIIGTGSIAISVSAFRAALPCPAVAAQGEEWQCVAVRKETRPAGMKECGWPGCGCDPHAEQVIAALADQGHLRDAPTAQTAAVDRQAGVVLPENLAEMIEAELMGWRGTNGGIYTIRAAARGVSLKIRTALAGAGA